MNQSFLPFLLRLAIFIVKTGQVENVLRVLIWTLKTKADYDVAMARLDGSYYTAQVKAAADKFRAEHPEDFKCDTSGVAGFDRWQEAMKKP